MIGPDTQFFRCFEKVAVKKEGKKITASTKQPEPNPAKEKSSKPEHAPKPKLVDEPDEEPAQPEPKPEPEHQGEGEEYDVEQAIQMSLKSFHVEGHVHVRGVAIREPISEEVGKDVDKQVNLQEKTIELHQGLAGSDPNPEPTHNKFIANMYPNVHERLKFLTDEHVILEDPLSSSGTLSSMKNLEDAYTIGDQFINDKSTKDESGKLNVEAEVVSMVTVLNYQASSSVPPLSTPVIDLSPPKPKSKTLDNTIQNLGSKVFTLELQDLPHKIDEAVRDAIKESIHVAQQAPLRDRFRELPEADMKEILHQQIGTSSLLKRPSHTRDAVTIKTIFLLHRDEQQSGPHSKHPVEDVPMPDTVNLSDSEDTKYAHLPKIKSRPEWLKLIPEEDIPKTPEPDWPVPLNDLPKPENN
ncbi:hypothetical protein Tco_1170558 [Tanacetum coccineum]